MSTTYPNRRKGYRVIVSLAVLFLMAWSAGANGKKNTLAIFNLRPINMEAIGDNADIVYALLDALAVDGSVELMPRRLMEDKLYKAGLSQTDNPETALKAGRALGVDFVLIGQVTRRASSIRARLQLLDVHSWKPVQSWTQEFAGRERIPAQMPGLAEKLAQTILNRAAYHPGALSSSSTAPSGMDIKNPRAVSKGKAVELRWDFDPVKPISAFNVYRSETEAGPFQLLSKVQKNLYLDTRIKKGRSYVYRIGIVLHSGVEIKSRHLARIENAGEKVPYPPLVIGSRGLVRRVEIKFVPSLQNEKEKFKIKHYQVYRKHSKIQGEQDAGPDQWEPILIVDDRYKSRYELAYIVEDVRGLEDGHTYIYAISSVDKKNRNSPKSDEITVRTVPRPVPAVTGGNLLRQTALSWEPLENAEGYYLYRASGESDTFTRVAEIKGGQTATYTDAGGLMDGVTYQYMLAAYDSKGETGGSSPVRAKTKSLPSYPGDIAAKSGMVKSVFVSWTPVNDPDVGGYAVYRGLEPELMEKIADVRGHGSLSHMDRGSALHSLEDGRTYYYMVAAYNLHGAEGIRSPAVHARVKPRPAPVKGLAATAAGSYIEVKWDKNPEPDITNYELFRNKNDGFWSKIKTLGPDQVTFKDFDLKPGVNYRYKVIATDKDDLKSDPRESNSVPSPAVKS